MAPALTSPWAIKAAAGQPLSLVRLRNLQFTAPVGADAWGRSNRAQPVLVSAEISLARAFTDSSAADKVDADTVHYGLLSKAVLAAVDGLGSWAEAAGSSGGLPLRAFLDVLWVVLTGLRVDGSAPSARPVGYEAKPFLALRSVRYLSVTVQLPKASLNGGGVSLMGISLFNGDAQMEMYGLSLRLHRVQVPTLIGVNSNEREAKQVVLADVEVDNFIDEGDVYPGLEKAVYEDMSGSSFATLESLAVAIAASVRAKGTGSSEGEARLPQWQIRIQLEKPVAVPLAEGAGIEYLDMADLPNQ